ncbi:Ribonuclease H2 subunit A [Golovinomyces cichoracearum]|uniref:Ribonuclease n=1 Tax=Golovinomyces cichoracearum TaxID=62708 RepID=A0A420ISL4_9PEZI|nr:Ribonuclease H2 subunit A [Golovinomyces cichoracearum]
MSESSNESEVGENYLGLDSSISKFLTNHSLKSNLLVTGESYTYFSDLPQSFQESPDETIALSSSTISGPEFMLGVDEAGRGPVLGPMVYGLFYLPVPLADSLLRETHQFDDSKVLTPDFRNSLMRKICTPGTDLHHQCGWAVKVLSARDIGSNMMKPGTTYNLNAQAMDATVALIKGVYEKGINVKEIYIDTIGKPETYQKKLECIFPTARITVAKKADSLYPCVSAASVCAKVTRDAALELLHDHYLQEIREEMGDKLLDGKIELSWGSGYPSDAKCTQWLKSNINAVFGWGNECRFSWGTAKNLLDQNDLAVKVEWPDEDVEPYQLTQFFGFKNDKETDELSTWFGRPLETAFF